TVTGNAVSAAGNSLVNALAYGGGISNAGTLAVTDSTVSANSVAATNSFVGGLSYTYGGGISNVGTLTVSRCTIISNTASAEYQQAEAAGGGIFSNGTLVLSDSTVSANTVKALAEAFSWATASGGGLYAAGGTLSVLNSTVAGNKLQLADERAGGG